MLGIRQIGQILGVVLFLGLSGRVLAQELKDEEIARLMNTLTSEVAYEHISHRNQDKEFSKKVFAEFLENLDPERAYFLTQDIRLLQKRYGEQILENIKQKNLEAFVAVKVLLQKRAAELSSDINGLDLNKISLDTKEVVTLSELKKNFPTTREQRLNRFVLNLKNRVLTEKFLKKNPNATLEAGIQGWNKTQARMASAGLTKIMNFFLNAFMHAYDPHSDFFDSSRFNAFMSRVFPSAAKASVGAVFGRGLDARIKVIEVLEDARLAGLKVDDIFVTISQDGVNFVNVENFDIDTFSEMIMGLEGTTLSAWVQDSQSGEKKLVQLARKKSFFQSPIVAKIVEQKSESGAVHRLGFLRFDTFYTGSAKDVLRYLREFERQKVEGLILDLRNNGGGSTEEAVAIAGYFISTGPIFLNSDARGEPKINRDYDSAIEYDGPLVIMTSSQSASASEIVVGALKDYGRALIVGEESTYGKGTYQTMMGLSEVRGLPNCCDGKVTRGYFYRVTGVSPQFDGISSDIVLPALLAPEGQRERDQKNALQAPNIAAVRHDNLNRVQPWVKALQEKSKLRVQSEAEFAYLEDDLKNLFKKEDVIDLSAQSRAAFYSTREKVLSERIEMQKKLPTDSQTLTQIQCKDAKGCDLEKSESILEMPMSEDVYAWNDFYKSRTQINETLNILSDYVELTHK